MFCSFGGNWMFIVSEGIGCLLRADTGRVVS
jgi:hypothetical protein